MRFLFSLSCILILSACMSRNEAPPISFHNGDQLLLSSNRIGKENIPLLETKAFAGDAESAASLTMYYAFTDVDAQKSEFWRTIALENDSPFEMYCEIIDLVSSHKAGAHLRARFWINKLRQFPEYKHAAEQQSATLDSLEKPSRF